MPSHSGVTFNKLFQFTFTCFVPSINIIKIKYKIFVNRRRETKELGENIWQKMKFLRAGSVAYETQIDFLSFVQLYRSFK